MVLEKDMSGRAFVGSEVGTNRLCVGPGFKNLKIMVVDDHDIIRRGLKDLLTAKTGWEVCAEAKTGREAVALAEQLKPDIIVMDISMPDLNGWKRPGEFTRCFPRRASLFLPCTSPISWCATWLRPARADIYLSRTPTVNW